VEAGGGGVAGSSEVEEREVEEDQEGRRKEMITPAWIVLLLAANTRGVNLEAAAVATWCDGSYAMRLPRSTSQLEAAGVAAAPSAMAAPVRGGGGLRLGKERSGEELGFYLGPCVASCLVSVCPIGQPTRPSERPSSE
jgi:hypothetical protein